MNSAIDNRTRREHERASSAMPVQLGNKIGITRDVSVSGIYFEIEGLCPSDREIDFQIDLDTPQGPMRLNCIGKIVRTEQHGNRTGIAVQMMKSHLAIIDPVVT